MVLCRVVIFESCRQQESAVKEKEINVGSSPMQRTLTRTSFSGLRLNVTLVMHWLQAVGEAEVEAEVEAQVGEGEGGRVKVVDLIRELLPEATARRKRRVLGQSLRKVLTQMS